MTVNVKKYGYPVLKHDNAVLREKGWEAWSKLQDERQARGFTYVENVNE